MKKIFALILTAMLISSQVAYAFFTVVLNGQSYLIPAKGDTGYSQGVNSLDAYLQALPSGLIQTSGGTMTGNLIMGNGANIQFTSPSLSLWPIYVDNNGNLNVGNLTAGTTTFAILNETTTVQPGSATIYVTSGTINNPNLGTATSTTTIVGPLGLGTPTTVGTVNQALISSGAGAVPTWSSNVVLSNSSTTFTGSNTFSNVNSTQTFNGPISCNGSVGTLNQALLSGGAGQPCSYSTIPFLSTSNTWTASNTFNNSAATVTFNTPISTGTTTSAVGSNGMTLISQGSGTSVGWAGLRLAQLPQCSTIAVSSTSATSTAFQNSNVTKSITPKYATSTIVFFASLGVSAGNAANSKGACSFQVLRGVTQVGPILHDAFASGGASAVATNSLGTVPIVFTDAPNTTSATTYTVQFENENTGTACTLQDNSAFASVQQSSVICLFEFGP